MKMKNKNSAKDKISAGSALILTIVLTSLLAVVGVMFLMVARVDRISTSAISENKELNLAVETVVARISQELVLDIPGAIDPNQEYYDYPDVNNLWLANLEPYASASNYCWQQISDVYDVLGAGASDLPAVIVDDYEQNIAPGDRADADGDGVADSRWVILQDMTSSKGKLVFAAIRVIDNSAMLNVNTAYKFDPCEVPPVRERIDGSSQMQINLEALARGSDEIDDISLARGSTDLSDYQNNVIWKIGNPSSEYLPFDISDELELRNRFFLTSLAQTRLEETWFSTIGHSNFKRVPYDDEIHWGDTLIKDVNQPDRRHLLTTYNMDRIIDPDGDKMVNVNRDDIGVGDLYGAILAGLYDAGVIDDEPLAAQIAVNLKDYRDDDSGVTPFDPPPAGGGTYYGFERPCIFISELAHIYHWIDPCDPNAVYDPCTSNPDYIHRSYAIELRKRHPASGDSSDSWRLVIDSPLREITIPQNFAADKSRYYVILFQDAQADLVSHVKFTDSPEDGETGVDPDTILNWPPSWMNPDGNDPRYSYDVYFGTDKESVEDANRTVDPNNVYKDRWIDNTYDPCGPAPLEPNTTYCWRIDDVYEGNDIVQTGDVWSFTTHIDPNGPAPHIEEYMTAGTIIFDGDSTISLVRQVGGYDLVVDSMPLVEAPWLVSVADTNDDGNVRSLQRDMASARFIKRLWDVGGLKRNEPTLGHWSWSSFNYERDVGPTEPIQVHLANSFNNIGDIGKVFRGSVYYDIPLMAVELKEENIRLDLANPAFQRLFKYLTVFDPDDHGQGVEEKRIKGRININTAPWYVIAQLPWVSAHTPNYELARAIVAYRDKLTDPINYYSDGRYDVIQYKIDSGLGQDDIREELGFASIGELALILSGDANEYNEYSIDKYGVDDEDQLGFPDLTTNSRTRRDGVMDDFEERDLIFTRISDLVTVRSDVFTAYILVRIGTDGPQKRVIAILDRGEVSSINGKVKIVALHPVPDPR